MSDSIQLSVPKDETVVVRVQKPKKARTPDNVTFRSYSFLVQGGKIYLDNQKKALDIKFLYIVLRKHGLSENIPITVMLGKRTQGIGVDWKPLAYNGPHVWYFNWGGVKCSITGNNRTYGSIWIRVHDLTSDVGTNILNELHAELLTHWKDPAAAPPQMLTLYTVKKTIQGHQWIQHSQRLHRDMNTIYINEDIKNRLTAQLTKFMESSAMYDKYGVTWKRVHLFHGPPGTGKTSTILALASMFKKNIAKLTVTPTLNSQEIETLFQTIPAGSWLILEDVDSLFVEREAKGAIDFSTLLNCMDGITTQRGLVLFMTTNHPTKLDEAFLRPGRVDMSIEFALPDRDQRLQALQSLAEQFAEEHEAFLDQNPDITIAGIQKRVFDCIMEEKTTII